MTKPQAARKVQVAIDKMIDLQTNSDNYIGSKVERVLDALRDLESDVLNSKVKNGTVTHVN